MGQTNAPDMVAAADKRQKTEREKALDDLRFVLNNPQGQRTIWRMIVASGVMRLSHVQGLTDATAFNEGARSVGLHLMESCKEADRTAFIRMMSFAAAEEGLNG